MTTRQAMSDVLSVITTEQISKYVIYGHSYGTVSATVLGSMIETTRLVPPRAIVLAGVLNSWRPWSAFGEPLAAVLNAETPVAVLDNLARLSMNDQERKFIGWLYQSEFDDDEPKRLDRLNAKVLRLRTARDLSRVFAKNWRDWIESQRAGEESGPGQYVLDTIECAELTPRYEPGRYGLTFGVRQFEVGIVDDHIKDRCVQGYRQFFASTNYQVRAPIYYFQGSRDVATSVASAKAHFDGQQISTSKVFTLVEGRGHDPLGIPLRSCLTPILWAIFRQSGDLKAILTERGYCRK